MFMGAMPVVPVYIMHASMVSNDCDKSVAARVCHEDPVTGETMKAECISYAARTLLYFFTDHAGFCATSYAIHPCLLEIKRHAEHLVPALRCRQQQQTWLCSDLTALLACG